MANAPRSPKARNILRHRLHENIAVQVALHQNPRLATTAHFDRCLSGRLVRSRRNQFKARDVEPEACRERGDPRSGSNQDRHDNLGRRRLAGAAQSDLANRIDHRGRNGGRHFGLCNNSGKDVVSAAYSIIGLRHRSASLNVRYSAAVRDQSCVWQSTALICVSFPNCRIHMRSVARAGSIRRSHLPVPA
ncbi:hypothetical protein GALL_413480 [mine drainage metagenome]|uniref:Uncharacterized protein n=1 Tax=mine drainage metagenome TaxID=410659 RepID=A0A1J5PZQ9_9ZZZZ